MKKIFSVTMVCLLSFLLVGCGCDKNKGENNKKDEKTKITETIEALYTEDGKLVYDIGGRYKMVLFHENDKVTAVHHYYEYKDEKEADEKYKQDKENLKNDISIKSIEKNGKYVVYVYTGEEYEGKSMEEIQNTYAHFKPVYKK